MAVYQLYLLALFTVFYTKASDEFSNKIVLHNRIYNVSYNFNETSDVFEFLVEVRVTGWVGFGFASHAPDSAVNYDLAVGGVFSNGTGYLQDYSFSEGDSEAALDSQQDWMLINSSEENGVTKLKFYRQRNTSDAKDIAIEKGTPSIFVYSFNSTSDDVHLGQIIAFRGTTNITFIPATTPTPSKSEKVPSQAPEIAETTTAPSVVTPTINTQLVHFANFLSFNNGTYNVSWSFNSSTDTLHFMVEVRATGWVGFGFATQAPTNMTGYDVAVGGVTRGSGYLQDYYTNGHRQPTLDCKDWMLSYSKEENGVTTLKFHRKRNTTDQQNDVTIEQGIPVFIVWAYHFTTDVQSLEDIARRKRRSEARRRQYFSQHTSRGFHQVILIPIITTSIAPNTTDSIEPTMSTSIVPATSASMASTTSASIGPMTSAIIGATTSPSIVPATYDIIAPTTSGNISATTTCVSVVPTFFKGISTVVAPTAPSNNNIDNDQFRFLWKFDDQSDMMVYHLRVKTTGWVGFGFAEGAPNAMLHYDVIVGGFSNGKGYLNDYFTRGRSQPLPDASQDYKLLNASEVGGYTELMFGRPRDTKDDEDLLFLPGGEVHIIWAYDDTDITDNRTFGIHSNRGWSTGKFVMIPEAPIPTEATAFSLHSSIHVVTLIIVLFVL